MISLDEALAAYAGQIMPLATESVALADGLHRVLRAPVAARCDLPRYSQSALDGYVLTAADAARAPCALRLRDAIAAGDTRDLPPLAEGECWRILTGARVPPNVGAVVAQERIEVRDGRVHLREPLKPGANIRRQGEELREGAVVGAAGQRLTPGLIGSLAAAGAARVMVSRAPKIGVLISGDELRPLGEALAPGQIWDSNGPFIATWLAARGYRAQAQHLPDDRAETEEVLRRALDASDLVVTSGGVSVGDRDYIIPVAEQLGVRRVFWQVAQKPGKPIYFGAAGQKLLLGLPGNPGAVLVGLVLHLRKLLDLLEGAEPAGAVERHGVLMQALKADARRERLVRMRLETDEQGRNRLWPLPHQDSHMLSNLAAATVLARLPARDEDYAEGAVLRWLPL